MTMVNTFIVTDGKDVDYKRSASLLDKRRLNKQIVEARQILTILEHVIIIADFYGWPRPKTRTKNDCNYSPSDIARRYLDRIEWYDKVCKKYFAIKKERRLIFKNGKLRETKREMHIVRGPYQIKSGHVTYKKKNITCTIPKKDAILVDRGEYLINLGFSQHPICKMWFGYEKSLKLYINSHIAEFCTRRKKDGSFCNTSIPLFTIKGTITHPWWRDFKGLYMSHRASLLRKEIHRDEEPWYSRKSVFYNLIETMWFERGYCWCCNLDSDSITRVLERKRISLDETGSWNIFMFTVESN